MTDELEDAEHFEDLATIAAVTAVAEGCRCEPIISVYRDADAIIHVDVHHDRWCARGRSS